MCNKLWVYQLWRQIGTFDILALFFKALAQIQEKYCPLWLYLQGCAHRLKRVSVLASPSSSLTLCACVCMCACVCACVWAFVCVYVRLDRKIIAVWKTWFKSQHILDSLFSLERLILARSMFIIPKQSKLSFARYRIFHSSYSLVCLRAILTLTRTEYTSECTN